MIEKEVQIVVLYYGPVVIGFGGVENYPTIGTAYDWSTVLSIDYKLKALSRPSFVSSFAFM